MMRLVLFLLGVSVFVANANTASSQSVKFTAKFEDSTLAEVFEMLEEKSNIGFLVPGDLLKDQTKISLSFKEAAVEDVLHRILDSRGYEFEFVGKNVVITQKPGQTVIAQPRAVKGQVTNSAGEPIPGVTVAIKGTTLGTISGADGSYSFSNVPADAILVFSFVGMRTQEIPVAGKTSINVMMDEETIGLEEVVAVGYGTQKKMNLTGAVSQVTSEVLDSRPITNVGQGLQGFIPNLNITQTTGTTGAGANFNIRGYESINGGEPLILVNNVPMDINQINPLDIESVSVLKDAASAAIYGARGAFGVILVTTKSGKKGVKPKVNLSAYYGINKPIVTFKTFDALQRATYMNTASYMQNGTAYSSFDEKIRLPGLIAHYNDPSQPDMMVNPTNPKAYIPFGNVDWEEILQRDYMPQQQYTATVSGGTDNFDYYTSVSYYNQEGINKIFDEVYERYNVMSNLNFDITDWATVGTQIALNTSHKVYPPNDTGGSWNEYNTGMHRYMYANFPVYDLNGNYYSGTGSLPNPVQFYKEGGYRKRDIGDIWMTVKAVLTPVKNMTFNIDYSTNTKNQDEISTWRRLPKYYSDRTIAGYYPYTNPSQVTRSYYKTRYHAFNAYADYENTFGKHSVKVMAGFNQENQDYKYFSAQREELMVEAMPYMDLAYGEKYVGDGASQYAIRGAFARLNYCFDNRYLVEFNGRYDGSSKFPKSDRFAFFPSVSAGWRLDNEPYLAGLKNFFDMLKIRGSYGSLGNQIVTGNYPYIASYRSEQVSYIINGKLPMTLYAPGLVSPTLTWETVIQRDIGLDVSALNNRLNANIDFYRRDTKDMLTRSETLPAVLAVSEPNTNAADLKTVGWDLSVEWRQASREVSWGVKLILSDYKAEITKFSNPSGLISDYYVGKNPNEIWGFVTAGIAQTDAEAQALDMSNLAARPRAAGDLIFEDLNDDDKITYGKSTLDDPGDRKIIGDSTPRYRFGLSSNIQWKGFDLNVFFQGVAKQDAWLSTAYWIDGYNNEWNAHNVILADWWSEDNTDAFFPRPVITGGTDVTATQTRWLQNAAYLRLKDLTIGYTIPSKMTSRWKINKMRVYFSGNNIWETTGIYKYKNLADPEMNASYQASINRTYSLGVNIDF
ncbi:MAG: TonB-dependent receptor [Mangrovibacterium sp.]|nr:TonB-dependent receptor [Mangrovibacterium sp.]